MASRTKDRTTNERRSTKAAAGTRSSKNSSKTSKKKSDRPFERVWTIVKRIPRGRVATYGQISELIHRRLTPIGVGWAIRAASEGSIPWHRVINGQGTVSTDREHFGLQRAMLEAEGIVFDRSGRVDLSKFGWRPRP